MESKPEVAVPVRRMGLTRDDLQEIFKYHAPDADQQVAYEKLRTEAREFALAILELVPSSADQTAAIRLVRQAVMTANAGIALRGRY